jgi:hypothetical protein
LVDFAALSPAFELVRKFRPLDEALPVSSPGMDEGIAFVSDD